MHTYRVSTGHVRLVQRKSGPVWYARWRRPDGNHGQKKLGPAWTKRGRPLEGYFTEELAKRALALILADADRDAGTTPVHGVTFGMATDEWLRHVEHDKACSPSTLRDYRTCALRLREHFGDGTRLERITPQDVEAYKGTLTGGKLSPRSVNRHLTILGGIFRRAERKWGIRWNPAASADKLREPVYGNDLRFLRPEQVHAVVRATRSEQDAATILTAALTGLRLGELVALRWQDVDFGIQRVHVRRSYCWTSKGFKRPKGRKVRSVPLVDEVIVVLDRLSQRERFTGPDDLVFPAWDGSVQYHAEPRQMLYAAMRDAGLSKLLDVPAAQRFRFHDLRHTFGTLAAQKMPLTTVQALMGHANMQTTMIYAHYVPAANEAAVLGEAFRASGLTEPARAAA